MQKKRIMINAFALRGGGGQTHLIKIINYLDKVRDFSVAVLLPHKSNLVFQRNDIEIIQVKWAVENPIMRTIWEIFYLPILLKKLKIDVLFCPGGLITTKVPKGVKSATMFRNMTPFDQNLLNSMPLNLRKIRNLILKRLMLRSMKKADLVIFISEFAEKIIKQHLTTPLKKRALIHHGVDFSKDEKEEDISTIIKFPYILYPSSIDLYKSQLEVIEAYYLLSKKIDLPHLVLLGSLEQNPDYATQVRESIQIKGLQDKVVLPGKVDFKLMPTMYRQSSFIIFASQSENCPNILLEAMSSGKLILCSNFQPMPEFAKESVIYFDPKKPEDLKNNLEMVMKKEDLVDYYSKKSLEESETYSWEDTSRKTWKSLVEII